MHFLATDGRRRDTERGAIKYFRAGVTNAGLRGAQSAATGVDREAAAVPSFLPRAAKYRETRGSD